MSKPKFIPRIKESSIPKQVVINRNNKSSQTITRKIMSKTPTPQEEIKPCPFCQSPARVIDRGVGSKNWYDIACSKRECHLVEGADWHHDTIEEAIAFWNKSILNPQREQQKEDKKSLPEELIQQIDDLQRELKFSGQSTFRTGRGMRFIRELFDDLRNHGKTLYNG